MGAVRRFLTNWWTVSIAIAVLVAALLCWGLPLVVDFLRPWWVRLILGVLVLGAWGLLAFLRIRKGRNASDEIAAALEPSAADAESAAQAERMRAALASLKSASGKRRDYLYSRPWYVIIGPPGSGKTTALLNSGLRFPFAEQALKGVGGTRNLDFWFADEAALIDTAGRYTSQDSDAATDSKAWANFLGLLKKNRPLSPINGILVAIGVDELIKGDRVAIDAHAAAVRRRLAEIRKNLEVAAPVYVLLTKADLLAGFVEFHEDLDVEGRRAVLGRTFDYGEGKVGTDRLTSAFDEVTQSVADRQAKRLSEEPDMQRRSLILGFPSQLSSLRPRLIRFLEGAFVAGDEPAGVLRGFYLTSGVQEGAPLDRLLSGMADVYDQPRHAAQGSGRAYFLNRLLGEVMFPEAGLVRTDPKAALRQKTRLTAALATIAALSLTLVVLWGVSFFQNRSMQAQQLAKAIEAQALVKERGIDLVQVGSNDADLEQALGVLDALRALPQGYGDAKAGGPPWSMTFGLFQSSHAEKASLAYLEGLRRILLPRLMLRLEAAMKENMANPLAIYEPLKVYLMLGGQRKDGIDAAAVRNWANADWAQTALPGADRADLRKRLSGHLDALLGDNEMASVWPNRTAPLDGAVVGAARAAVQTMTVADRAYAILKQKALAGGGDAWVASTKIGSGDAPAFADGNAVLSLQVPFFFTRGGYEKAYQPGLLTVQRDLENDLWVLGAEANTDTIRQQIGNVRPGVAARYAEDYVAAWENVVKTMKPAAFFGSDLAAFGAFTKTPPPWKLILLELRNNTTFSGGTAAANTMLKAKITSKLGQASQLLPTAGATFDAATIITDHFKDLHAYVGTGAAPAPIDDFITAVKNAGQAVIAARSVGGGGGGDAVQAALANANAAVSTAAAGAPPILKAFVGATAQGGTTAQTTAAQGAVNEAYANVVAPSCKNAAQDKYPFFATSSVDARVTETIQAFGFNGVLDAFVKQRLMPLLDISGPVWRWKTDDPIASQLDPGSADQFAKAGQVRDLLAAGIPFKVSVETMGTAVDAIEFAAAGNSARFDATDNSPRSMQWSTQATPEARITFFKGTQKLDQIATEGPWAVFRLIDRASRRQNAGPTAFLATFGDGDKATTIKIALNTEQNPFARGGVWTFRCPVTL
jgi:type VI secretion system protein ImpL